MKRIHIFLRGNFLVRVYASGMRLGELLVELRDEARRLAEAVRVLEERIAEMEKVLREQERVRKAAGGWD